MVCYKIVKLYLDLMKKFLIVLVVLGIALALSPIYIQRGVIRNFADITDYQFFDNDTVKAGVGQPWKISERYNQKTITPEILKKAEKKKTIAYLVIQNDSILFEQYWDGYSDSSLSGSFSMAKSVVSLLIGIALEEGKIGSLDDKIAQYIPEFDRDKTDQISIKDVLTMSAGFKYVESYFNIFGKTAATYYGDNLNEIIGKLKSKREPGKIHYYSSAETQVLGWILENVYQQPLAKIFSEKLWTKIGAEHDALWSTDKKGGNAKAFCCLNSNARDFARLGQLVLQNGQWNGEQIVPAQYIQEATTPATWLTYEDKPVDFYGYQMWIMERQGLKIPYFWGILGQLVFIIPEKNAVVIRLGERIAERYEGVHAKDAFMYVDEALKILE